MSEDSAELLIDLLSPSDEPQDRALIKILKNSEGNKGKIDHHGLMLLDIQSKIRLLTAAQMDYEQLQPKKRLESIERGQGWQNVFLTTLAIVLLVSIGIAVFK